MAPGRGLARPGLATEAGAAAVEFGFTAGDLERIVSIYEPENAASGRVMDHLGFTHCLTTTGQRGQEIAVRTRQGALGAAPRVGDIAQQTAVEPVGDGPYPAMVHDDWEIWGPCGGYVAALALRAPEPRAIWPVPPASSATTSRWRPSHRSTWR